MREMEPLIVWLLRAENIVGHRLSVDETRTVVAAWFRAADMHQSMSRTEAIIMSATGTEITDG